MEYLNKINNEFDILRIDITENNKEFKSHGLGQKRRKRLILTQKGFQSQINVNIN